MLRGGERFSYGARGVCKANGFGMCDFGCRKEEGKNFTKEAAMAKYYASVVAQKVSGSAIEWAGGVGFTRETGIEKFWRDSKIVRFPSLTTHFRSGSTNADPPQILP